MKSFIVGSVIGFVVIIIPSFFFGINDSLENYIGGYFTGLIVMVILNS